MVQNLPGTFAFSNFYVFHSTLVYSRMATAHVLQQTEWSCYCRRRHKLEKPDCRQQDENQACWTFRNVGEVVIMHVRQFCHFPPLLFYVTLLFSLLILEEHNFRTGTFGLPLNVRAFSHVPRFWNLWSLTGDKRWWKLEMLKGVLGWSRSMPTTSVIYFCYAGNVRRWRKDRNWKAKYVF